MYPDSPCGRSGVKAGDLLTRLDGEAIADAKQLRAKLAERVPDQPAVLTLRRGREEVTLKVQLGRLPEDLPPPDLPPGCAATPPGKSAGTKVGRIPVKLPEARNEAWAYVPENYDPGCPHGLVVWLHAPGTYDEKAVIARWKPHCERYGLIVSALKAADADKWEEYEAPVVLRLIGEITSAYHVDPTRIVLHGREGGGTLAFFAAFAAPGLVHAVATVDGPMSSQGRENDPAGPLAFYVARTQQSRLAAQIEKTISSLRQLKYPVTVKSLGQQPRDLNPEELAELARWIDMLDRI